MRCKECKAVISWGMSELLNGEVETPKLVSKDSIKAGKCKECFDKVKGKQ